MRLRILAGVALAAWLLFYRLGRTWGSTRAERARVLPGDDVVPRPSFVTDHAITIDATPERVWPWLAQMGWHRGGWYTYRWVDVLLFPDNLPSAETIVPEWQHLAPGDRVLDGAPETGCFFTVEQVEADHALVLFSTTHLPPRLLHRPGIEFAWTWAFVLAPHGVNRTWFHFRSRARLAPWWLRLGYRLLVVPADFVMARSMCMGIKRRAERLT